LAGFLEDEEPFVPSFWFIEDIAADEDVADFEEEDLIALEVEEEDLIAPEAKEEDLIAPEAEEEDFVEAEDEELILDLPLLSPLLAWCFPFPESPLFVWGSWLPSVI
jgi:hypothetical protein